MKVIGNLTKDAIIRAAVSEGLTVTQAVGTDVVMNSGSTTGFAAAFDSSTGKVVVAFSDGTDGQKGKAIVGTVDPSNNSISFGSEVVFQNSEITGDQMDCVFDSNANKVVICYTDTNNPSTNSRTGTAIVGTVSGTSISFGTKAAFESGKTKYIVATFDSNSNKVVVAYEDDDNSDYGTAAVGTISGTDISFGTPVVFDSQATEFHGISFDSNANKVVIAYRDFGLSIEGRAVVGTVSGTSISFGSTVSFTPASADFFSPVYDSVNDKTVIFYRDANNSDYGTAKVGTVSGTSISFGDAVVFNAGSSEYIRGVYDAEAEKIALVYKDGGNSNRPTFISGAVSGTSITFDTETVLKAVEGVTINPGVAYDSTNKRVVAAYLDSTGSDNGLAQVIKTGYSSATGGTIADGKPVIVNANGTVSSISQTAASLGTEGAFNSSTSSFLSTVFDSSNNKHIITYRQGNSIRYVVATVAANGSVSFGTDAQAVVGDYSAVGSAFDSTNNRIVIVFKNGATYAMVGSLSGTTVTWGSVTEVHSGSSAILGISFDSTAEKVIISYIGSSSYGTARVGTVSGTSISFGTAVVFNSGTTGVTRPVYDSTNNRTVIAFKDGGDSNKGKAVVGTVSGTDISFGSEVVFESGQVKDSGMGLAFDSDTGKVVIAYRQNAESGGSTDFKRGTAVVGTVSGTSISFGTPVAFDNTGDYGENTSNSVIYDTNAKKVLVVYPRTVDGSYSNRGFVFPLAVSGTTIVADTPTDFAGATAVYPAISFDSNVNKSLIAFGDAGNSEYGTAVSFVPLSGNLTSENFLGFMDGAALDGTNGEILSSCSIARNQTSLTPGQTYFVTPTGTLSTTAGSPSVTAGTAISSTELIVKG